LGRRSKALKLAIVLLVLCAWVSVEGRDPSYVVEIDPFGKVVWNSGTLPGPVRDVDPLANGDILILLPSWPVSHLIEVNPTLGNWSDGMVKRLNLTGHVLDVEILRDGHIVAVDLGHQQLAEYDWDGKLVTSVEVPYPRAVEVLPNGNVLVSCCSGKYMEFDASYRRLWQRSLGEHCIMDILALPNGDIVMPDEPDLGSITEVDGEGNSVWQLRGITDPNDIEWVPEGIMIVADGWNERVVRIARNGTILWEVKGFRYPADVERLPNGNILVAVNPYALPENIPPLLLIGTVIAFLQGSMNSGRRVSHR